MIILSILLWGMLIGWIANMILGGGSRPENWVPPLVAGLAGSFVGGLVINLVTGNGLEFGVSGVLGSILGAVIVLAAWGAITKRKA